MTKLGAGYVVVDVWKAKPGKENEIEPILADAWRRFSDHPDILSIDYARAEGNSGRFLVVFRYRDEQARERFVATDELKSTMSRLSELWDLDGIFYKGPALEV